ncbi:molybdate ABC transporter substrate-binding protein [Aquimarina sp. U1-2]|uniref:molybdate ABC transporter substrate-binding protein n=1 Tax=Aquimarina sp. U1-2 TaxID=2823141 RepID=UPI001AECD848|nr:molybdate ABC transporter substrate-binding protein [Aquimarina sp. U1-2]MBP2834128.1 molybdate ABC transporter substrate-binding protein [Aquimarina sp. U1-2]
MIKTFLLGLCISVVWGCTQQDTADVVIATAANTQYTVKEIASAFTKQTGIHCTIVVSSSGKLTTQIQEGAPYDVFISADTHYPAVLYDKNLTVDSPKIYGYGTLVLWSATADKPIHFKRLTSDTINHIAIANPKIAPYGDAAVNALRKSGIYSQVVKKLVYGESIAQTNQFIISGAAQIGFTAKSVVLSPQMQDKGYWIAVDSTLYTPIAQASVLLKKDKLNKNALAFYSFLFSTTSQKILENYGYLASSEEL